MENKSVDHFIGSHMAMIKKYGETWPKLDVTELTLILKAAGFRLETFDFLLSRAERNVSEHLRVEIQCHKSGIISKLVYKPKACSCQDEETAHNSSFWEVQAAGCSSQSTRFSDIHDASSTLLPDVPTSAVQISNDLLKLILINFERTQREAAGAPANSLTSPIPTDTNDHNVGFNTPLSSINITPMNPDDFPPNSVGIPKTIFQNNEPETTRRIEEIFSNRSELFRLCSPNGRVSADDNHNQLITNLMEARLKIDEALQHLKQDPKEANTNNVSAAIEIGAAARPSQLMSPNARRHTLPPKPQRKSISNLTTAGRTQVPVKEITPMIRMKNLVKPKITAKVQNTSTPTNLPKTVLNAPRKSAAIKPVSSSIGSSTASSMESVVNGNGLTNLPGPSSASNTNLNDGASSTMRNGTAVSGSKTIITNAKEKLAAKRIAKSAYGIKMVSKSSEIKTPTPL